MNTSLAIGTRYWNKERGSSFDSITEFIKRSLDLAESVIIAVNIVEDKNNTIDTLSNKYGHNKKLLIVPVEPWGFTSAMNALVYKSALNGSEFLLTQSVEVKLSNAGLNQMMSHMDDHTLCVGARMEGHEFHKGKTKPATGRTIPWNTCRILNLEYYQHFGFPLVGDAPFDQKYAGVEELSADSLIQLSFTQRDENLSIKLIEVLDIKWETTFEDPERAQKHAVKIKSKVERPAMQMQLMGIPYARVTHI